MKFQDLFTDQKRWSMLYLGVLGLLFLAAISGNERPVWAATGPTIVNLGTTVQHSNVKRLGINVSGQLYYDSAQMLRDITFNNPGFESEIWQSILTCTAVNGNTCTDGNGWSQWPLNFLQEGSFNFIYGSAKGKTGTIVSMTKASGNGGAGAWYNFGSVKPAIGDTFIVKKSFPGDPGAGWMPGLSGGATITGETNDLSPHTPGKQALVFNALGNGKSAQVTSFFDSTPGRSFLQMKGSYTIAFRAKSVSGSKELNVSVGRLTTSHGNVTYFNQQVPLTNEWQDFTYTFNADEDGTYVGTAFFTLAETGGEIYLDDASVTESASAGNTTPFRDAVVDRLKELNPGVLRYMDSGYSFGTTIDNMIAVPGARLRTGFGQGSSEVSVVPMGLEEFLELCKAVGAEPWYTIPMGVSPTETQDLIQFLGGDSSTPYGAKRAALGQSAPWTSVFPSIHIELGDEAWNAAFSGDIIQNPAAYGSRIQTIFSAARASSSYEASKFDLIMDGWAAVPYWNQQAMNAASNEYDTIDVAPYTFDTFTSFGSTAAVFGSMFAQPESIDSRTTGSMYQQSQAVTGKSAGLTGKPANLAVYEVNLGTTTGSAPQSVINATVPSLGAGLSTAEHMLLMMRDDGVNLQTMFALPGYQNGYTNINGGTANVQIWGTVIDMGGQTNLCRPQFLAEQLANTAIGGSMIATTQSGGNPTWDEVSSNDTVNPINIKGAHYIQSFAFVDGTENSLILFNLNLTSSLPVTFTGANAPHGTVQQGLLTSANLTDTNEATGKVAITNSTISNFNPAGTVNLPPHSMTVYRWSHVGGVTPPTLVATTTSLTATPTTALVGKAITLTAKVKQASGSVPTGAVVFTDNGATIGTVTSSGGNASFSTVKLAAGSHSIVAKYEGSTADGASVSPAISVAITSPSLIKTTTTLKGTPTTTTVGKTVALTATVKQVSGSVPAGSIIFKDKGVAIGTVASKSGVATLSTVKLAAGAHSLVAEYAGSATDGTSSSSALTVDITSTALISTTTTLTGTPTTTTAGKTVALTARVKQATGSVPAGSVIFKDKGVAIGTVASKSGVASLSTVKLATGTHSLVAEYVGSSTDRTSSSSALAVDIKSTALISTTTKLTAPAQLTDGQTVTLKAVVAHSSGAVPTGTVTFYAGSTKIGSASLSNGQASLNAASKGLAAGTYALTASYSGNAADSASKSPAVSLKLLAITTKSALALSATNLKVGQTIVAKVKVTAASGTAPTGTVRIYAGSTLMDTLPLSGGAGTFTTTLKVKGTYQVYATYQGSSSDATSTSSRITITSGS